MKAAIVTAAGKAPIYGDFEEPTAANGQELISVRASALSTFTKSRASGSHYSSEGSFPIIAGADGVGVTQDGRRLYFALPDPPFGALAELCAVSTRRCVPIPHTLDDITAAAIANPGMSAWTALVERARLVAGETVLVNGATGTAGRLAVQLAKFLGAGKVIATARNAAELESLKKLGADLIIPFELDTNPSGAKEYERALSGVFTDGIDVVIDYLWGESARTIIVAIAKTVEDATPVRFVHVGGASGDAEIALPGAALRSSALVLMGSGVKSVPMPVLLSSIKSVFEAYDPAALQIATRVALLSDIETEWKTDTNKPRLVITIP